MFRIKICGVTSVEDVRVIVEAGADAIGVNFYSASPRWVSIPQAAEIVAALPPTFARVGVFVNAPVETIRATSAHLQLDYVQLHGDEPPEVLAPLSDFSVIRAVRLGSDGSELLERWGEFCRRHQRWPAAFLVDAYRCGSYGGTGQTIDWHAVHRWDRHFGQRPLILAGGLVPENVAQAIRIVRPDAVDTASGVESSAENVEWPTPAAHAGPSADSSSIDHRVGSSSARSAPRKDHRKIREFVREAKAALNQHR